MRMLLVVCLLAVAAPVSAQPVVDPSGHWEGTIQVPDSPMAVEIDLARDAKGALAGTFGQPAQGVKGFPLANLAVEGRTVRFVVRAGEAPSTFTGTLSEAGTSMSGDVQWSGYTIPFALTRTGAARIAAAPKNGPIGKALEGAWSGAIDLGERKLRIILTLANRQDGTSAGTVVSPDGSGVEIPVGVVQKDASVTIEVPSVGATFAAVLNAAATELAGTWTQNGNALPLTLRK